MKEENMFKDPRLESARNVHSYVVRNPETTFFMRANGNSMRHKGIFHDDVLIVDRSLAPMNSSTVVVICNGELLVREWCVYNDKVLLCALQKRAELVTDGVQVWGVVTYVIHKT